MVCVEERTALRHRQLRRSLRPQGRPQRWKRHRTRRARSEERRHLRAHLLHLPEPHLQALQDSLPLLHQGRQGHAKGLRGDTGQPALPHAVGRGGRPQRPAHPAQQGLQGLLRLHAARRAHRLAMEARADQHQRRRRLHMGPTRGARQGLRQQQCQDMGAAAHRRHLRHPLQSLGIPLAAGHLAVGRRTELHHAEPGAGRSAPDALRRQLQVVWSPVRARHPGGQRRAQGQRPLGGLLHEQGGHVGGPHPRTRADGGAQPCRRP